MATHFRKGLSWLMAHPVLRSSIQISVIYATGDFTQQRLISKVEKYDYTSTKNIAIVGGCMLSPMYVAWYGWLDKVIPGTTTSKIVKKIVVDQLIAGTTATCLFFIVMSILEKKDDIFAECKEKAPVAYLCNFLYWPFIMFGIFKKVPMRYQPVAVACGDFFWSIFLCFYKMRNIHPTVTETSPNSKVLSSSLSASEQQSNSSK